MVVQPGVGAEVASEVVLVNGAMPTIAAAPRDELDLCTRRAVKVSGLIGDVDLELLNTLDGSGHHACRVGAGSVVRGGGEGRRVGALGAVHVAAVIAAIELE